MKVKAISFILEIGLKSKSDNYIYAYENVSYVPTSKLIEIFEINLEDDPNILEGYMLTEENYFKHREYILINFIPINLNVFEYCLRQYECNAISIRKLYKESLME